MKSTLIFVTSFFLTIFFLPKLANIASQIGLMDKPGERKVHSIPKPLVGGIGMAMALSIACLLYVPLLFLRGFYAGLILLVIMGFFDDFREVDHWTKFGAQIAAAIFAIYFSDSVLRSFGDLFSFGPITLGVLAVPATIFCIIGVTNALNMIDGLDGLAGGISLIAFFGFVALSHLNHQPEIMFLSIAFSGAVAGFLIYNWSPSRLFMGDAGSLCLGFSLAFLSIVVTQKEGSVVPPVVPLLILAVPIVDTVTVMVKRIVNGKSPFHADSTHIHHILMRVGFSKTAAVWIILAISSIFTMIGILGVTYRIPDYYLFSILVLYFVGNLILFKFYPIRLGERDPALQDVQVKGGSPRIVEE
jgi:UDP-GlcNAc:undecaprenyl-phosphate GlcNAc-1-phosphate transferase